MSYKLEKENGGVGGDLEKVGGSGRKGLYAVTGAVTTDVVLFSHLEPVDKNLMAVLMSQHAGVGKRGEAEWGGGERGVKWDRKHSPCLLSVKHKSVCVLVCLCVCVRDSPPELRDTLTSPPPPPHSPLRHAQKKMQTGSVSTH